MNEADTRAELIDPALLAAGWGVIEGSRVRRETIALGRIQGGGRPVGDQELDPGKLGSLIRLKYDNAYEAERKVGPVGRIRDAFIDLQTGLYDAGV